MANATRAAIQQTNLWSCPRSMCSADLTSHRKLDENCPSRATLRERPAEVVWRHRKSRLLAERGTRKPGARRDAFCQRRFNDYCQAGGGLPGGVKTLARITRLFGAPFD